MNSLTQARLQELLHYDPETGIFTWAVNRGRVQAGAAAGTVDGQGYVNIQVSGRIYTAHRLAVLYMTGDWPTHDVDHWNLVKGDNRWRNLRQATGTQNEANKPVRIDNTSGFKGVYRVGDKFAAQIKNGGKKRYLGRFDSAEEAHRAYVEAANDCFGAYMRAA